MSLASRSRLIARAASRPAAASARRNAATAAHAEPETSDYPSETFRSKLWPITAVALIGGTLIYRASGRNNLKASNPLETTAEGYPAEAEDTDKPFLTRYLAYHFPRAEVWQERNEKHLEVVLGKAADKLLMQDAEMPRLRRRRYSQGLDQASPHSVPVGLETDNSDFKIDFSLRPNMPAQKEEGGHH